MSTPNTNAHGNAAVAATSDSQTECFGFLNGRLTAPDSSGGPSVIRFAGPFITLHF
jgi:hypothetical protein